MEWVELINNFGPVAVVIYLVWDLTQRQQEAHKIYYEKIAEIKGIMEVNQRILLDNQKAIEENRIKLESYDKK